MKKNYIVVERNFQYNDEVYEDNGGYGTDISGTYTKEEADALVEKKNLEFIRNKASYIESYLGYDYNEDDLEECRHNNGLSNDAKGTLEAMKLLGIIDGFYLAIELERD